MDSRKSLISALTALFLVYAGAPAAYQVVLEDLCGQSYSMYVDPDTSVKDFIDTVQSSYAEIATYNPENQMGLSPVDNWMRLSIATQGTVVKASKTVSRDYHEVLTPNDQKDIYYIVKTLATTTNWLKLWDHETPLMKAGDRIRRVHPLNFLACIFTNEELKVCMLKMEGKAFVWKRFIDDLTDSLAEAHNEGNLMQFAREFAKKVKIDYSKIEEQLKQKKWKEFIVTLIHNVPRLGEPDKYKKILMTP